MDAQKKRRVIKGQLHGQTVYYDIDTKNKSFLEVSDFLKRQGIRNHKLMLLIKNPEVIGIDPWSENLSLQEKALVLDEVTNNFWYFIREVFLVATSGNPIPYKLNRANFAINFLMINNINTIAIMPRQHGKTVASITLFNYMMLFGSRNTSSVFTHKSYNDAVMNLQRLKDSFKMSIPSYLSTALSVRNDKNQEKMYVIDSLNNKVSIVSPANNKNDADKAGRGMTTPLIYIDEIAFIKYIKTMYTALAPAFSKASKVAEKNNMMYGILITTTPGSLVDPDAQDAKEMVDKAAFWDEKVLDWWMDATDPHLVLKEWVAKNSENDYAHVEFTYKQLGNDDVWFKEQVRLLLNDMEKVKREIQLEWTQSSNNSPFSEEALDAINKQIISRDDYYGKIRLLNERYTLEAVKQVPNMMNKNYIVSVDVSGGLDRDSTAISVIDPVTMEQLMYLKNNSLKVPDLVKVLKEILTSYIPNAILVVERNSYGLTVLQELQETEFIKNLYYSTKGTEAKSKIKHFDKRLSGNLDASRFSKGKTEDRTYGINTDATRRNIMINEILFMLVNERKELINNPDIFTEIKDLERKKSGKIEHADGKHDDLLFSYFIGLYPLLYDHKFGNFLKNVSSDMGTKTTTEEEKKKHYDHLKTLNRFKNYNKNLNES